jgi:hypothetical protein
MISQKGSSSELTCVALALVIVKNLHFMSTVSFEELNCTVLLRSILYCYYLQYYIVFTTTYDLLLLTLIQKMNQSSFTPRCPEGRGLRGPFFVGVSMCQCVDVSICTVLPLNAHTTKTCLLRVSSIQ